MVSAEWVSFSTTASAFVGAEYITTSLEKVGPYCIHVFGGGNMIT